MMMEVTSIFLPFLREDEVFALLQDNVLFCWAPGMFCPGKQDSLRPLLEQESC